MEQIEDIIFIALVCILLINSVIILMKLKNKERKMRTLNRAKKDRIDLEKITRNIETNYHPINIDLTKYEKEQENNAIISYEELISNRDKKTLNYDETYKNNADIFVKKVNLNEANSKEVTEVTETKIEVNLMAYEKEEAFLKALRKLQSDLAR